MTRLASTPIDAWVFMEFANRANPWATEKRPANRVELEASRLPLIFLKSVVFQ